MLLGNSSWTLSHTVTILKLRMWINSRNVTHTVHTVEPPITDPSSEIGMTSLQRTLCFNPMLILQCIIWPPRQGRPLYKGQMVGPILSLVRMVAWKDNKDKHTHQWQWWCRLSHREVSLHHYQEETRRGRLMCWSHLTLWHQMEVLETLHVRYRQMPNKACCVHLDLQ